MDFNGNLTNGKVVYDLENSGYIMEEIQRLITPPNYIPELNTPKILLPNNKKAKSNNHEYCDSCLEGGELICCDKCPVSFHLQCCDPPFNGNTVPLGNWVCHKCKAKEVILKYLDSNSKMQSTLEQSKCHPNPEQNILISNKNDSQIYNIVPNNKESTVETLKLEPYISNNQNNTKNISNNVDKNPEKISRKRTLNHQTPTDMSYAKRRILRKTLNLNSQIQSPKIENGKYNIKNDCQNNLGFTPKDRTLINVTEFNTSTQENTHKNSEKSAKNEISPKINVDQMNSFENIHKTNNNPMILTKKPSNSLSYETIIEHSEGWNLNSKYCVEKFPRYINYTLGSTTRKKEEYLNRQNQESKTPSISENLANDEWLKSLDTIVSRLKLGNPCEFRLPKYVLTCPYKFPGLPKIQYTLPLITASSAMNTKSSKMETKINDNKTLKEHINFLPGKNFKRSEHLTFENPEDNFNKNKDKVPTYVNNRRKKVLERTGKNSPDSEQEILKITQKTENCPQNMTQKNNNSLNNFNNNSLNQNSTLIKDVVTIKYGPNILNRTSNHKANTVNALNTVNKTVSQICVLPNSMSTTKTIGTPTQESNADQLIFEKTNLNDDNHLHCKNEKLPRCFVCTKSYISAPLIQCDYCPLYYHMDCLSPPLTCLSANLSWICPNHVENILEEKFWTSHESLTDRIAIWDLNIPYFAQYCNTVYGPKKINNFTNNKIITCKNSNLKNENCLNKDDFNDKNVISILHLATMNGFFHKVKRRHPPFNLQREIALDFKFYYPLRKLENEFYFPDRFWQQINQLNYLFNPKFGLFNVPEKRILDTSKNHIIVCNNDNHKSQKHSKHKSIKNLQHLDKVNKNKHINDIRSLIAKLCTCLCNVKSETPIYPQIKR